MATALAFTAVGGETMPIEVTIGAYQVGLFKETGGVKPAETIYQTFRLIP